MVNHAKKLKNGKLLTIYIESDHIEHIKRIARKMSLQEGRDISTCEAVRMAVEECYPLNRQMNLPGFDPEKKRLKQKVNEAQLQFV